MKILKLTYLLLILTGIMNSSETRAIKYGPAGNSLMYGAGNRDVFHNPNFLLTWKLDVKFSMLKDAGILGDELQDGQFNFVRDIFHSFKNLPDSVSRIHMYGNGKVENTTMLMFGNVDAAWLENYVVNDLYNRENNKVTYSKKVLTSGLQDITKLSIQHVESVQGVNSNNIYFSAVKPGLFVISSNIYEIRRWRDYPRSVYYYKHWPKVDTLLSFEMDLEDTIKNMKSDGVKNINMLKSKVFTESKGINIVVRESEEDIFIGSHITTKEAGQAEELKDLLISILSVEGSASKSGNLDKFLENLRVVRKDKSLQLISVFSKDATKRSQAKE